MRLSFLVIFSFIGISFLAGQQSQKGWDFAGLKATDPTHERIQLGTDMEPSFSLSGPVVWSEPAFPTQFDDVTIYFNANEGNGGLAGFDGDVYAHTGVITENSSHPGDWKYVVGQWGTDVPETKMTSEGDDIYSLSFNIQDFYGVPDGELVKQLAFVFRNVDGSVTGRDDGGGDIFLDIYPPQEGLFAIISSPDQGGEFVYIDDSILIEVTLNQMAKLDLYDNEELIFSDSILDFQYNYIPEELNLRILDFVISLDEDTIRDFREIYVLERANEVQEAPENVINGLNYFTDSTLLFKLFAPNKDHVFFLTYENNFSPAPEYRMKQSSDGSYYWLELPKEIFTEGRNAYIYLIDLMLIADPYSTLVLDPSNDSWVPEDVLDELPEYPSDRLPGMQISVFEVEKPEFDWTDQEYTKPEQSKLVIYELLMRDFLEDQNYKSLLDTLDYFQKLGITAIELMPVMEFEGNQSWGYNPSFHMALDKAYGSIDQFKAVINEAHNRGIAIILDVVYNHVFSTSPLARLYWDDTNFRPTAENPYLNVTPKHPFNVGYDVNHESTASKEWVKQTLKYWMEEFHIDGFRFDLSKGFTQKSSGGDDVFRQYDQGRISILKDYADFVWSIDDDSYIILEHFAANDEETELANYGMMLWGRADHDFGQAAEGRSSSLDWADYKERGWNDPHLIPYIESHDEERLMYKLINYGLSDGDYSVKDPETALTRVAAAATIFYMLPGPKMLWQFGELGYDYSINWCTNGTVNGCRLDPKPVRWDYLEDEGRAKLKQVIENLLFLRNNYSTFSSLDYTFSDGNFFLKTIHHNHPDMDAVTMVNYRVTNSDINPKFPYEGTWYEYFTGDSLEVVDTQEKLTHGPGEYRIYTSKRITPPGGFVTSTADPFFVDRTEIFPNPVFPGAEMTVLLSDGLNAKRLELVDMVGRQIAIQFYQNGNTIHFDLNQGLQKGMYALKIIGENWEINKKMIVQE